MDRFIGDLINPEQVAKTFYTTQPDGRLGSRYIPFDDEEVCCLIKGTGCSFVDNVVAINEKGKIGIPYILTLTDGSKIVLKIIEDPKPFTNYTTEAITAEFKTTKCMGHGDNLTFFGSDMFTNEVIIGNLLRNVLLQSDMPLLTVDHIKSGLCSRQFKGTVGAEIMEYANLGSVDKLANHKAFQDHMEVIKCGFNKVRVFKKETILNIVKQIVVTYDFLSRFGDFNHGDAKVANALVTNDPINIDYQGLHIDSPFTIKIADFDKAAITIKVSDDSPWIRFYNKSRLAAQYFKLFSYNPTVSQAEDGSTYYHIGKTLQAQLYAQSRHTGLPFYHSYDIYTFMVSFLLIPEVFHQVENSAELQAKIWHPLWYNEDVPKMFIEIRDAVATNTEPSFSNVINILDKTRLKCEVSTLLIERLKSPFITTTASP